MPFALQPRKVFIRPRPFRARPRGLGAAPALRNSQQLTVNSSQWGAGRRRFGFRPVRRGIGALSGSSSALQTQIASAAVAAGLDPTIALAQAQAESNFNPNAIGPVTRSGQQAAGLFQFMPATAAQFGITNPYDPTQSITGRNAYYSQLLAQFGGDQAAALAAYNWGPGNVQKAQAAYGSNWLAYAPLETQNYVAQILGSSPAIVVAPVSPPATDLSTFLSSDGSSADSSVTAPITLAPASTDSSVSPDATDASAGFDLSSLVPVSGMSTGLIVGGLAVAGLLAFFVLPEFLD